MMTKKAKLLSRKLRNALNEFLFMFGIVFLINNGYFSRVSLLLIEMSNEKNPS